jgi:hypothetical protein
MAAGVIERVGTFGTISSTPTALVEVVSAFEKRIPTMGTGVQLI